MDDYLEYNTSNHVLLITTDNSFLMYDIPIGKTTKEIIMLIESGETKSLTCQYIFDNHSDNLIHVGYYSYSHEISPELYLKVSYHIETKVNCLHIWKIIDDNMDKYNSDNTDNSDNSDNSDNEEES